MGVKRNLDAAGLSERTERITEHEAALYDRQIRLWGMECQKRLRDAKILVIGLNGVGAEIVKNLTLSGVKSITLLDDTEVKPLDCTAQFFVSGIAQASSGKTQRRSEASASAVRELNPNVAIFIATGDPNSKPDKFFQDFNAVIATDLTVDVLIKINKTCREHSVQFYCADSWGFYGYAFLDLHSHTYRRTDTVPIQRYGANCKMDPDFQVLKVTGFSNETKSTKEEVKITEVEETKEYCPLGPTLLTKVGEGLRKRVNKVFVLLHVVNHFREMFNRYPSPESRESDLTELKTLRGIVCEKLGYDITKITDEMLSCVFGELSPVCATLGGVVVNEIIKGISRNGLPVYNYYLFDGNESFGVNEKIIVPESS